MKKRIAEISFNSLYLLVDKKNINKMFDINKEKKNPQPRQRREKATK